MSLSDPTPAHIPDRDDDFRPDNKGLWLMIASVVLAISMSLGFTYWQVQLSQHRWCTTLGTLNEADAHAQPPKTEFGRNLVKDFNSLYQSLGCG